MKQNIFMQHSPKRPVCNILWILHEHLQNILKHMIFSQYLPIFYYFPDATFNCNNFAIFMEILYKHLSNIGAIFTIIPHATFSNNQFAIIMATLGKHSLNIQKQRTFLEYWRKFCSPSHAIFTKIKMQYFLRIFWKHYD